MKKFRGLILITLASVLALSLTACGGNKSASKSSGDNDSKSEVSSKKKTHKKQKNEKKSEADKENSEEETSDQQNASGQTSGQKTNNNATSSNSATSTGTNQKTQTSNGNNNVSSANRSVNTTDDAISLYAHYLGMQGNPSSGYTATPISGGFVVTPKEPAYGHAQVVIKYDGSAYGTDGRLIATAAQMMAPNNPNTSESGWHGV